MDYHPYKAKEIASTLYIAGIEQHKHKCRIWKLTFKNNRKHGYTNLMTRIKTHDWRTAIKDSARSTLNSIIDSKS